MTAFLTGLAFGWFIGQEIMPLVGKAIKTRLHWPKIAAPGLPLGLKQKIRRVKARLKIWMIKRH